MTTTDKNKISNGFNSFFVNVGPNLAKNIPDDPRSPSTFMKGANINSMLVIPVIEEEVISIIKVILEIALEVQFFLVDKHPQHQTLL